jgi:hypothetical protein
MKTREEIASDCVEMIIDDMTARSGPQNAWENVDARMQREIRETWKQFILDVFPWG